MKVIVCGGRDFKDLKWGFSALDYWADRSGISLVILAGQVSTDPTEHHLSWEARRKWGADYIAKLWAEARRIKMIEEVASNADLKRLGVAAGPTHNRLMLDRHKPELVIDLCGGSDTSDMLGQARARGIRCVEVSAKVDAESGSTP